MKKIIRGDTKQDIINATIGLLKETNIFEISSRMIAEKVKIRKASLFHHFPNMEELFLAVIKNIQSDEILNDSGILAEIYFQTSKSKYFEYLKFAIDRPERRPLN